MGLDVIITGANRGIGLGFTEFCLARGDRVTATYRTEESLYRLTEISPKKFTCLRKLQTEHPGQLTLQPLDVTSEEDVARFAATVEKLDLLILNAGIKGYSVAGTQTKDHPPRDLRAALEVNTLAPNHIWSCFYRIISKTPNAGVIYMGSLVGLANQNTSGHYHPYRISKSASHHMMWNLMIQLAQEWRGQTVKELTNEPFWMELKDSIRAVLPGVPDPDQMLEVIERAITTTPLNPQVTQSLTDSILIKHLEEWLQERLPEGPLKQPLQGKLDKALIQTPFQLAPGIDISISQFLVLTDISISQLAPGIESWIYQALELTQLIDAERIKEALLSSESITHLFQMMIQTRFHLSLNTDSTSRCSTCDMHRWVEQVLDKLPYFDEQLKLRISDVLMSTPLIQQWRDKMFEALRQTPFAAAICAGWVKTDMGGPHARLSIQQSTTYMMGVVEILLRTKEANGLLMYDGTMAEKYSASPELEEIFYAIKSREASVTGPASSS